MPSGPRRRWPLLAGVVAIAVSLVGAAVVVVATRSEPERFTVELVAADDPGDDPFVEGAPAASRPGFTTLSQEPGQPPAGESAAGTSTPLRVQATSGRTPGLYGSSAASALCDVEAIASALAEDGEVAETWAELMGIGPGDVDGALALLTPVLLGRDTLVTNSSFRSGVATTFPAILQAGTPVLIDRTGTPRVKCSCGNPLLAPPLERAAQEPFELEGARWNGFDVDQVTAVEPSDSTVREFATVDVDSGELAVVPAGSPSIVTLDGYLVLDRDGVHVDDGAGRRTTVIDHEVAVAFDDGAGGLVYQELRSVVYGGEPDRSFRVWDLATSSPASRDEAIIWHLPAGAAEPVPVTSTDDPATEFAGLMAAGPLGDRPVLVYARTTIDPTTYEDQQLKGDLVLLDLATGEETVLDAGLWAYEGGAGVVDVSRNLVAWTRSGEGFTEWRAVGPDLGAVDLACSAVVEYPDPGCGEGPINDEGVIVSIVYADIGSASVAAVEALRATRLRTGERLPPITAVATPGLDDGGVPMIDVRDGDVVFSTRRPPGRGPDGVGIDEGQRFALGSPGEVEAVPIFGQLQFLSAPLRRPGTEPRRAEPEVEPPVERTSPSFDEIAGATVPSLCEHPPTTLVDGRNLDIGPNDGDFQLLRELSDGSPAVVSDIPSDDRGPITLVVADCYHGGVGWPHFLEFFSEGAEFYAETSLDEVDWEAIGLAWVARSGVSAVRLDGERVIVDVVAGRSGEPFCCPSATATVALELRGGAIQVVEARATS